MGVTGMVRERENLKIVVIGHVDHGKSTLIGRLLYDTKSLPEGAIAKVKRISKEKGKPFEYAYLLDAFEEEQKQGITIDITQIQFNTSKRDYIIIDAPGHKEFLKNMISGAASADAALLLIDAQEGIQEQSRRHGYMLSLLGIRQVYVVINKMDLANYVEEKFLQIRNEMHTFLESIQVYPLKYIPISAFNGENITEKSFQMPWYHGEPILDALDIFETNRGLENKPLRFPIQAVYKFDARRIIAGRIEAGSLRVGDKIVISPGNKATRVKSIEHWLDKDQKGAVQAGMSVGITLEDEFFNSRGELISHEQDAPLSTDTFAANVIWLGKQELMVNRPYKLKLTTQEVECKVREVRRVIDATTLQSVENPSTVKLNDVAEVIIETKRPVAFDQFRDNQNTGRFVLVDGYDVSGGGIIAGTVESAGEASTEHEVDSSIANQKTDTVNSGTNRQIKRLVTRQEREFRDRQKGKVIWLAGSNDLSNEIAVLLEKKLFDLGQRAYYVDQFELARPKVDSLKVAEIARILAVNGTIAIVAYQLEEQVGIKAIIPGNDLMIISVKEPKGLPADLADRLADRIADKLVAEMATELTEKAAK